MEFILRTILNEKKTYASFIICFAILGIVLSLIIPGKYIHTQILSVASYYNPNSSTITPLENTRLLIQSINEEITPEYIIKNNKSTGLLNNLIASLLPSNKILLTAEDNTRSYNNAMKIFNEIYSKIYDQEKKLFDFKRQGFISLIKNIQESLNVTRKTMGDKKKYTGQNINLNKTLYFLASISQENTINISMIEPAYIRSYEKDLLELQMKSMVLPKLENSVITKKISTPRIAIVISCAFLGFVVAIIFCYIRSIVLGYKKSNEV
ncbi:MAG: hypothetical protein KIT27_06420 [Legionellales bacterium]|nr:hypothetical protein [Legionellales bacterium]